MFWPSFQHNRPQDCQTPLTFTIFFFPVQSGQLSIVGKPTAQSTTHNENYTSDKAVDGSQGTYLYPNNVCSHTGQFLKQEL